MHTTLKNALVFSYREVQLQELNALYQMALESAGLWDDDDFVADFQAIIGMMLVLRNPLSSIAINHLLANPHG